MKLQKRVFNIILVLSFLLSAISGVLHEPLIDAGVYKYIHVPASYTMLIVGVMHVWRYRKVVIKSFKK